MFDIIDTSNDSNISKKEYDEAVIILQKMNLQDVTFEDVDIDNSGNVTLDEFIDCMMGKIEELEISAHGMEFIEDEDNMISKKPVADDTVQNENAHDEFRDIHNKDYIADRIGHKLNLHGDGDQDGEDEDG